jgi:suppressor of G2 allele of SKP1
MPDSKVKHDWYQTETHVVIEVRIKGLKPESVKVEFGPSTLTFSAPLPDVGVSEYCLDLDLAHPVNEPYFKVF